MGNLETKESNECRIMGGVGSNAFGTCPILGTKSQDIFAFAVSVFTNYNRKVYLPCQDLESCDYPGIPEPLELVKVTQI